MDNSSVPTPARRLTRQRRVLPARCSLGHLSARIKVQFQRMDIRPTVLKLQIRSGYKEENMKKEVNYGGFGKKLSGWFEA